MKKSHGGKRKNSGRPKEGTTQYVARLTIQQVKWLQSITDAGGHLQAALAHYMATAPATKRRAKRPERARQRPSVPKDAQSPYEWAASHAEIGPASKFVPISYRGDDGATYYVTMATKNEETAKFFGKDMSSPETAARLTVAEVRATKQAAYQKTLTSQP